MLHEKSGFYVLYINYIAHADYFSFSASGTINHKTKTRNGAVISFDFMLIISYSTLHVQNISSTVEKHFQVKHR